MFPKPCTVNLLKKNFRIGYNIFSRSQLPDEAKKFDQIDKNFRKIMAETVKNPKVKDCCHANNRLQDLQMLFEGLERCQKSLNDYLDSKRNAFPRLIKV